LAQYYMDGVDLLCQDADTFRYDIFAYWSFQWLMNTNVELENFLWKN